MDQNPCLSTPGSPALRVLIVEDTVIVADEIVRMVTSLGCVVVETVGTVQEGLRAAAAPTRQSGEEFDLALLDVNLNGELVYPVADALLERRVPVVFLTGYARGSLPARFRHVPCLEKPFSRPQLAGTIEAVSGHALGR